MTITISSRSLLIAAGAVVAIAGLAVALSVYARNAEPKRASLFDADKKAIAMQLVSSAENSTLDWKGQYGFIKDIGDGRGYTAGIIGFTSATHDMLALVKHYTSTSPGNVLAKYLPALEKVDGTPSHEGLDPDFVTAWKDAATDPKFQQAQDHERDRLYFEPSVDQAIADGLGALGQFMYYDATVVHGPGNEDISFSGIRKAAMKKAKTPTDGGDEAKYLNAFLDARRIVMLKETAHQNTDRVDLGQRKFLREGNLELKPPLKWTTYGDRFSIK